MGFKVGDQKMNFRHGIALGFRRLMVLHASLFAKS